MLPTLLRPTLLRSAGELTQEEVERLVTIIQNPRQFKVPDWMLNRKKDVKDGKFSQVVSNTLDMKLREDLERLKKIRAHRGLRHYCAPPPTDERRAHSPLSWIGRPACRRKGGQQVSGSSQGLSRSPGAEPLSWPAGRPQPPSPPLQTLEASALDVWSREWEGGGGASSDHPVPPSRCMHGPERCASRPLLAGGLRVRGQRTKTTGRKGRTVGVSKHCSMYA